MENNQMVDLLKRRFHIEAGKQDRGGVYALTQRKMAYNSNRIEGSTLTEKQTASIFETGTIRAIQFHGQETEEEITRTKRRFPDVPVIRAVSMKQGHELRRWDASDADYLLLDAGNGGTGHTFDHSLITQAGIIRKPWFLAGGMRPDTVQEAVASFLPFGIDCSSGVETEGWKDPVKIRKMIENVRGFVSLKKEM